MLTAYLQRPCGKYHVILSYWDHETSLNTSVPFSAFSRIPFVQRVPFVQDRTDFLHQDILYLQHPVISNFIEEWSNLKAQWKSLNHDSVSDDEVERQLASLGKLLRPHNCFRFSFQNASFSARPTIRFSRTSRCRDSLVFRKLQIQFANFPHYDNARSNSRMRGVVFHQFRG